jgi:hypothetical protein
MRRNGAARRAAAPPFSRAEDAARAALGFLRAACCGVAWPDATEANICTSTYSLFAWPEAGHRPL